MPEKRELDKKKRETTSFKVDPELWKEVKIESIKRDVEVSDFVDLALRKELGKKRTPNEIRPRICVRFCRTLDQWRY